MVNVPLLRAHTRFTTGSGVTVDVTGHVLWWLWKIQLNNIQSYESEWLELGGSSGSGDGTGLIIVNPSVLDDPKLLFDGHTKCTRDAGGVKADLQELSLFQNEFSGLQMTVPTNSLEHVKFGPEVIKKASR